MTKNRLFTSIMAILLCSLAFARNTTSRLAQITSPVTLSADVDLVITNATTPFTETGSVNIANTEHAVIILENIRPSDALAYLPYIKINGEDAVNNETCQVKMYAHGSIILPYGKDFKPLTVYSEQNFGGESVNDFGLENSGGYMNTLSTAKLNNRIRSFKLKRGYMVTFSNSPKGRGYSRCFIADKADLEFATLPAEMDKKISSYRVFKWHNFQKKGIASDGGKKIVDTLRVTWCYDWAQGNASREPNCEWVPHHIYEDYPSAATCGSVTQSCHMQTNNEPGNSSDDRPQSVETVLANWENLMATGMRLCSPSSHDGSRQWLYDFIDSIDARGWRCDILDMHCYWNEWNLNNELQSWYERCNKRPIWVSEFVWGSSWGNNGIFATDRSFSIENQQRNYDVMNKVLTNWNKCEYIERYAYWNSEADCSKLFKYDGSEQVGQLSILGKWYAEMNSGIGYNKSYEYVPKAVCRAPQDLTISFDRKTQELELTWNNPNMEFTDSTFLEMRLGEGEWKTMMKYESSEESAYTFQTTFDTSYPSGLYTFRIHNYDFDKKERYSKEVNVSWSGAEGTGDFQYGRLEIGNTNEQYGYYTPMASGVAPYIFVGLTTHNNTKTGLVNNLKRILAQSFIFRYYPWAYGANTEAMTETESSDFMVFDKELKKIGDLTFEVGTAGRTGRDGTRVTFATPFPEGVTPVVIANVVTTSTVHPYMVKVWDIDNEGFSVKLARQAKEDEVLTSFVSQTVNYVAAAPGQTVMANGKILTVGTSPKNLVDGRTSRLVTFTDANGDAYKFLNPYMLCGPQTDNYDCASIYRVNTARGTYSEEAVVNGENVTLTKGMYFIRQKDDTNTTAPTDYYSNNGDIMGWIIVSDPTHSGDGICEVTEKQAAISVDGNRIVVEGDAAYDIYTLNGTMVPHDTPLPKGMYIVKTGNRSIKVLIP